VPINQIKANKTIGPFYFLIFAQVIALQKLFLFFLVLHKKFIFIIFINDNDIMLPSPAWRAATYFFWKFHHLISIAIMN